MEGAMKTHLYLLAPAVNRRQAEVTRDFLAIRPFDRCYCSPERAAARTAAILAEPHGLTPEPIDALRDDASPEEITQCVDDLLAYDEEQSLLLVAVPPVQRRYFAALLDLSALQMRRLRIEPCGVSIVVRDDGRTRVQTLNAAFHVQGLAA
jgi:broad specificity phosphatase PhoE